MPPRKVTRIRGSHRLASVEQAEAAGVLDEEGVYWQRLVAPAGGQVPSRPALGALGADNAGGQAGDLQLRLSSGRAQLPGDPRRSSKWVATPAGTAATAVRW